MDKDSPMRVVIYLAICVGSGALSQALAADQQAPPAQLTHDEQLLLQRGFHAVQEKGQFKTDNGQKIFCRKLAAPGSRIASREICGTVDQLNDIEKQTQEELRVGVVSDYSQDTGRARSQGHTSAPVSRVAPLALPGIPSAAFQLDPWTRPQGRGAVVGSAKATT
jgi:hypothetical protein